ncbi:MAG: purine-binding chemotaxis protein CheW, partial [Francisellaceae bacterium]
NRAKLLAMIPGNKKFNDINKLLVFKLGQEKYAIDDEFVESVLAQQEITTIPLISKPFVGVIYYQGEVLPVIDTFQVILNENISSELSNYDLVLLRFESSSLILKVTEVHSQIENIANELENITIIDPVVFSNYLD